MPGIGSPVGFEAVHRPRQARVVHVADWEDRLLCRVGREDLAAKLWSARARLFAVIDAQEHGQRQREADRQGLRTLRERATPASVQVWADTVDEVERFMAGLL